MSNNPTIETIGEELNVVKNKKMDLETLVNQGLIRVIFVSKARSVDVDLDMFGIKEITDVSISMAINRAEKITKKLDEAKRSAEYALNSCLSD